MNGFRVDTKLFQELGQYLVAKESTALVELIKNAYDADATIATVSAFNLDDPDIGRIIITDDGVGMGPDEFDRGFLTIAGRTKDSRLGRSRLFGRSFTGEKGVGRLAAHKLGTILEIESRTAPIHARTPSLDVCSILRARIDWNIIENLETIDQIPNSEAVTVYVETPSVIGSTGTKLSISPLRTRWTRRMKSGFTRDAATIVPLPVSYDSLPKKLVGAPLLFDRIPIREGDYADPGFEIVFGGELSLGDLSIPVVASAASWIAEIDHDGDRGLLRVAVAPTATMLNSFPDAEGFRFETDTTIDGGPSFRARILQRSGPRWDQSVRGVRVFMEGFRVDPYGGPNNDWLGLEEDYGRRAARQQPNLDRLLGYGVPSGLTAEELQMQSSSAYLGSVFLYRASSGALKPLVNREGFLSAPEFDFVADWTRVTIDLMVRLGASARTTVKRERKQNRVAQREAAKRADLDETPTALRVRDQTAKMRSDLTALRAAIDKEDYAQAVAVTGAIRPALEEVSNLANQFGSEAVQWRILASLGTELAAFIHEINSMGVEARGLVQDLEVASATVSSPDARSSLSAAKGHALELAERIRRNATYLVDTTSFEGRRRRSTQLIAERFKIVSSFFDTRMKKRQIRIENRIPVNTQTPPMFPAELSGILMNLMSNAVKFTNEGGRIRVCASDTDGHLTVRIENTGVSVDLETSARLFEPFRSTTERPDPVLGQGMGMGLPIARAFVREYGGQIGFVAPSGDFATAIEFRVSTK